MESKYGCSDYRSDSYIDSFIDKVNSLSKNPSKKMVEKASITFWKQLPREGNWEYCPFPDYLVMYYNNSKQAQ